MGKGEGTSRLGLAPSLNGMGGDSCQEGRGWVGLAPLEQSKGQVVTYSC